MEFVLVIVIGAVIYGTIFLITNKKKTEMMDSGKIIERGKDYIKQAHFFTTKTASLADVGNAMDKTVLAEQNISLEPDYTKNVIVFRYANIAGMFIATLRFMGEENEQYKYRFQIDRWQGKNGAFPHEYTGNVLLTAVEKAFMKLDGTTAVERVMASYTQKTKTSFI